MWLPLACSRLGTWPATQACALTGNQTGDLLVRRPALNPLSHTSQGSVLISNTNTNRYNLYKQKILAVLSFQSLSPEGKILRTLVVKVFGIRIPAVVV